MLIAICDDAFMQLLAIKKNIEDCFLKQSIIPTIKAYTDPEQLLEESKALKFDALFLDIDMPIKGFDVADEIASRNPHVFVIYVTNYRSLAKISIRHYAFRFIEKNNIDDFEEAVTSLCETFRKINTRVSTESGDSISLSQIIYISAGARYANIHTEHGVFRSPLSLSENEEKYKDDGIVRISRSKLVNLYFVDAISKDCVILSNKEELKVSRSLRSKILGQFYEYYKKRTDNCK